MHMQKKAIVQHLYMGRNPPMFTELRVIRESTDDDHLVCLTSPGMVEPYCVIYWDTIDISLQRFSDSINAGFGVGNEFSHC